MSNGFELDSDNIKIGLIGLGYVGLPLAVEFGKQFDCVGFDIDCNRVEELGAGRDATLEVGPDELAQAAGLSFSCDLKDLGS